MATHIIRAVEDTEQMEAVQNRPSFNEETFQSMGMHYIPFEAHLSFAPLIRIIEGKLENGDPAEQFLAETILNKLEETPFFREPIEDRSLLEQHKELLQLIMLMVISPAVRETQLSKISAPFEMTPIYLTPALKKLWEENTVNFVSTTSDDFLNCTIVLRACSMILNKFYGQNINIDYPILLTFDNEKTGMRQFFKTGFNTDFLDIKAVKPLKPLSQEKINELLSNVYDKELWLRYLEPDRFEFHGFFLGNLIDITAEESLSRIKHLLLEKDAVMSQASLRRLESFMRIYFNMPELRLGLTAIDYPKENMVAHRYKIRFDFLAAIQDCLLAPENANSIYEKACKYREILLVEDLKALKSHTPIERDLLKVGLRSIIVSPLFSKDNKVIGLLEIASPKPFEMHSFIELKFKEITGLFSIAVERSREETDNQIEALIREKYTAIHPSVEWKFIESAFNMMEQMGGQEKVTLEPIVFNDVYPLYGQADIVSSSHLRNNAIQADLMENLQLALETLKRITQTINFPLAKQAIVRIEHNLKGLNAEFNSNDESRIVEILDAEIHPLLRQLSVENPDHAPLISRYFDALNPEYGIIYKQRKDYEESVEILAETIASLLDHQEKESQKTLPHYFEKYKTDGVEYDIYLGQSLLRRGQFSQLHLKNFRLWQLLHMVEITRKVYELQDTLPVPLTTAQLVFVYSTPLAISFRMDEKQFDVDGAYNVRYEILKKRIDKSTIEGTDERLTQAGKIAIVYLHEKDRLEYLEYLEYLRHEDMITDEIEDVSLGKLQGVQGLRALRVTVKEG
ncbi:MAG: hypothetical protein DHS20C18_55100 [Saprospiraceae bacterium]|nr:MAG: hypothetical protein DHS20C18_55100 [Saprospiraceae bacterium]